MSIEKHRQTVLQALSQHAQASGRTAETICLIAVSKTFPAQDIRNLYQYGQRDFGENYIQEWLLKHQELQDCPDIVWHIIGHIQSNKSRVVAEMAHWVHTIDRFKLAQRLNNQRPDDLPALNVCIEINIAQNPNKHGVLAHEMMDLAQSILSLPKLKLRGLMCVADPAETAIVQQQFSQMQSLFNQLKTLVPDADTLSMGMSGDWQTAMENGATHFRIGSAIFGQRDNNHQ